MTHLCCGRCGRRCTYSRPRAGLHPRLRSLPKLQQADPTAGNGNSPRASACLGRAVATVGGGADQCALFVAHDSQETGRRRGGHQRESAPVAGCEVQRDAAALGGDAGGCALRRLHRPLLHDVPPGCEHDPVPGERGDECGRNVRHVGDRRDRRAGRCVRLAVPGRAVCATRPARATVAGRGRRKATMC